MSHDEIPQLLARLTNLVEHRLAPALDRIADALERPPAAVPGDPRGEAVRAIRRAIDESDWAGAGRLAREFDREHPEAPESEGFASEIRAGRAVSAEALRGQFLAAQSANDAGRVLDLRDELAGLLDGPALAELDRQAIGWLMALIGRRLRIVPMPADVPELAARVAERFAATAEGASLLKALPTLRRSAGLCPRCGRPYRGLADACPACLAASSSPAVGGSEAPSPDEPAEEAGPLTDAPADD